jgi:hypothetical protein
MNIYEVIYSDGKTVLETFAADNLTEAKAKAKENRRNYKTAHYLVRRCYQRGIRANSGESFWH